MSNKIIEKMILGAKWSIYIYFISIPVGLIINFLLAKISPQAVGIYSLFNIYISFIATFMLFGGNNVIIKYLPKIPKMKKINFLFTYILLNLLLALFFIFIIFYRKELSKLIIGANIDINPMYMVPFILFIILYSVFDYSLNGLMEIKRSSIIKQFIILANFISLSTFFVLWKDFFRLRSFDLIYFTFLMSYILATIMAMYSTIKNIKKDTSHDNIECIKKFPLRIYFPDHFWEFSIVMYVSAIINFMADKLDQMIILNKFDISELGIYYITLQIATLIRIIPTITGSVLLPTYSNLIASKDSELIKRGYREAIRYNTLVVISASLFCMFYSKEILSLFGNDYVNNYIILIVLVGLFSTGSMSIAGNSLIIVSNKVNVYLAYELIIVAIGSVIMYSLTNRLGILGLAIGKGSIIAFWQIASICMVKKLLEFKLEVPKEYKIGVFISLVALILQTQFYIDFLYRSIIFVILLIIFLSTSGYNKKDIELLIGKFLKSR